MRPAFILIISLASGVAGFLVGVLISSFFETTIRDEMPYLMAFVFLYLTLDHFVKEWPWGESKLAPKMKELRGR